MAMNHMQSAQEKRMNLYVMGKITEVIILLIIVYTMEYSTFSNGIFLVFLGLGLVRNAGFMMAMILMIFVYLYSKIISDL